MENNETQKAEAEKPKETTTDTNIRDNSEGLDKVERAEQAVKRIEEGEKRLDEKIKQLQDLQADRLLGGTAGGRVEAKEIKEETPQEYRDRVLANKL